MNNKIDFAALVTATKCNPNGTFEENRPRQDANGHGEMSKECISRKIRNRLQDMGERILVQAAERADDSARSIHDRAMKCPDFAAAQKAGDKAAAYQAACQEWFDVRAFGQVFALKNNKFDPDAPVSFGVNGPVSIQPAETVDPVDITTMTITKSVNGDTTEGDVRSADTVGSKSRVEFGLYVIRGSINCSLADKTGLSDEDAEKILKAVETLFENDESAARPAGSMEVRKMIIWRHSSKSGNYGPGKVQRSLHIEKKEGVEIPSKYEDYDITIDKLEGLTVEEIDN